MHRNLEALFILDNVLTDPSKDYLRLVHKKISKTEIRGKKSFNIFYMVRWKGSSKYAGWQ